MGRSVERLAQLFYQHEPHLNSIHISAILTKLAKLEAGGPLEPHHQHQPPELHGLEAGSSGSVLPLPPGTVTRSTHSLQSRQLLEQLVLKLQQQGVEDYTPRGIANVTWALAKLQYTPDENLRRMLLDNFCDQLQAAVPQDISNVMWAMAKLTKDTIMPQSPSMPGGSPLMVQPVPTPLLSHELVQLLLGQLCQQIFSGASCQTISNSLWAVMVLQQQQQWCMCGSLPQIQVLLHAFIDQLHQALPAHIQPVIRCMVQLATACSNHAGDAWISWQPPLMQTMLAHLEAQTVSIKQHHVLSVLHDVARLACLYLLVRRQQEEQQQPQQQESNISGDSQVALLQGLLLQLSLTSSAHDTAGTLSALSMLQPALEELGLLEAASSLHGMLTTAPRAHPYGSQQPGPSVAAIAAAPPTNPDPSSITAGTTQQGAGGPATEAGPSGSAIEASGSQVPSVPAFAGHTAEERAAEVSDTSSQQGQQTQMGLATAPGKAEAVGASPHLYGYQPEPVADVLAAALAGVQLHDTDPNTEGLAARQLTQVINSSETVWQLQQIYQANETQMDVIHLRACITRLCKILGSLRSQQTAGYRAAAEQLLQQVGERMLPMLPSSSARDLANVLWGYGRLQIQPSGQVFNTLLDLVVAKKGEATCRDCSVTLWSLARLAVMHTLDAPSTLQLQQVARQLVEILVDAAEAIVVEARGGSAAGRLSTESSQIESQQRRQHQGRLPEGGPLQSPGGSGPGGISQLLPRDVSSSLMALARLGFAWDVPSGEASAPQADPLPADQPHILPRSWLELLVEALLLEAHKAKTLDLGEAATALSNMGMHQQSQKVHDVLAAKHHAAAAAATPYSSGHGMGAAGALSPVTGLQAAAAEQSVVGAGMDLATWAGAGQQLGGGRYMQQQQPWQRSLQQPVAQGSYLYAQVGARQSGAGVMQYMGNPSASGVVSQQLQQQQRYIHQSAYPGSAQDQALQQHQEAGPGVQGSMQMMHPVQQPMMPHGAVAWGGPQSGVYGQMMPRAMIYTTPMQMGPTHMGAAAPSMAVGSQVPPMHQVGQAASGSYFTQHPTRHGPSLQAGSGQGAGAVPAGGYQMQPGQQMQMLMPVQQYQQGVPQQMVFQPGMVTYMQPGYGPGQVPPQ